MFRDHSIGTGYCDGRKPQVWKRSPRLKDAGHVFECSNQSQKGIGWDNLAIAEARQRCHAEVHESGAFD